MLVCARASSCVRVLCSFVLVCASPGPWALVCPCLPRSWSCLLGRVWFVCARVCLCVLVCARASSCVRVLCSFVLVCASPGPCSPRSWSCVLGRVWFVCARVCLCALVPARVSACFARSCSCVLVPASACSCVHRILRVWKALGCEAESMRKIASWSSQWSPHWLNLSYLTCFCVSDVN